MAEDPQDAGPQIKVIDRRWWARPDGDEPADDRGARKPSYVEDLERQIAEQGAQLQAFSADHRRSLEEFEEVKARIRRDVAREVDRGKRAVLAELLEVVDNLDRAVTASRSGADAADAIQNLARGVELVRDQFLAKLAGFGVTRFAALGQPFDPERHDAVSTMPVADAAQDETVVAVIREGYAIEDTLLRPASVVLGRLEPQG